MIKSVLSLLISIKRLWHFCLPLSFASSYPSCCSCFGTFSLQNSKHILMTGWGWWHIPEKFWDWEFCWGLSEKERRKIFYLYSIFLLLLFCVPQNVLEVTQTWREQYFRCLHISETKCSSHLEVVLQINILMIPATSAENFLDIHLESWPLFLFHNAVYIEQRPKRWPNAHPPVIVKGRDGVYKCAGHLSVKPERPSAMSRLSFLGFIFFCDSESSSSWGDRIYFQ